MQLFVNNWSSALTLPATTAAVQLSVSSADAALLTGLGAGDYYLLTLAQVDIDGLETAWEVVRVTGNTAGVLDVLRGQEGTGALELEAGTAISARLTQATMETLRDSGGPALSDTVPQALGVAAPGISAEASRGDHAHAVPTPAEIGAATAAQGALAASAVQPGTLATVATSGSYIDLASKPSIPATAAEVGAIAATEKGAASGVATLDAGSKIPLAQLPATAITDTSVVASEAAMLALTAQTGDVAIRTDISTSFILKAEPASTLTNWQEILAPSAGGGAAVGNDVPQALGSATPGVSASASRQDHVHPMPSAADVGATPASHVGTGGAAHADVVAGGASGFMTGAQATKLAGIAAGATVNDTDANLKDRANHTGEQAQSTVTGLTTDLAARVTNPMIAAADLIVGGVSGAPARLAKGSALQVLRMNAAGTAHEYADPAGGASLSAVATFTGNKTLALTDINTYSVSQDATAQVVTLPAQATVAWTADAEMHFEWGAVGAVTVTAATGVTINGVLAGSFTLAGQYSAATLKRIGVDSWTLIGALANDIVTGPASAGDGNLALFDGTTGKVIKDGGVVTAAGLALLDDASAAAQATTLGLGAGNSPTFTALTLTNGQVVFPATQVPSANANTLDDYEEGTWTPVLTFATPGDLSVSYSSQIGTYTKIGNRVFITCVIVTTSFTHTAASGACRISGLPFSPTTQGDGSAGRFEGITKASYTALVAIPINGTSHLEYRASGSGVVSTTVNASDMPSGGTVILGSHPQYTV